MHFHNTRSNSQIKNRYNSVEHKMIHVAQEKAYLRCLCPEKKENLLKIKIRCFVIRTRKLETDGKRLVGCVCNALGVR